MAASPPPLPAAADLTFLRGGLLLIRNAHNLHVKDFHDAGGQSQVVVTDLSHPANSQTFLGVTAIVVTGTKAADYIELEDDFIPAFVSCGDGDDTVLIRGAANVIVYAGNGNDTLRIGQNTVIVPSRGTDTIDCWTGSKGRGCGRVIALPAPHDARHLSRQVRFGGEKCRGEHALKRREIRKNPHREQPL